MRKTIFLITVVGSLGVFGSIAYAKSDVKATSVNFDSKKVQIRCSMCDGTGFTSNAKGEKGKGKFACVRCKGTGKI